MKERNEMLSIVQRIVAKEALRDLKANAYVIKACVPEDAVRIERYEHTEKLKENMRTIAYQIVERIMAQAHDLENCVPHVEDLVVFISGDLLEALAWLNEDILHRLPYPKVAKICGYDVIPIHGEDELYIGFKA